MNQFVLVHNKNSELRLFPHILEAGVIKNSAIRLNGFPAKKSDCLKIYYIQEGRFEWVINNKPHTLFPGDLAFVLPGSTFGNTNNVLEIGSFSWIHLSIKDPAEKIIPGEWSCIADTEIGNISAIIHKHASAVFQKFTEAAGLFRQIQTELFTQAIGYYSRVNHLLDEFLIQVARHCTVMTNTGRDFPATFMKLEQELRRNLSHQWTVEEMAAIAGLGTTLFNERVKNYSGFSPQNYLINIRISEAIKLLKKENISLTDIALDTGFYSSQHFSTTFKKLTGYTPSQFRKNHL